MARFLTEVELRAAERRELARRRGTHAIVVGDERDADGITAETIILDDESWRERPTGLVTAQGRPIYRRRHSVPIGFRGKGG
jgi:hypothetical protein